jgi:hypothetical protein
MHHKKLHKKLLQRKTWTIRSHSQIYKTITISNNQTGQIYLQKTFNFTSGEDRKIETIITQPIPPNATLKIEIQIQITITTPTFTWTKTITKTITTTIGTTTKTEITTQ